MEWSSTTSRGVAIIILIFFITGEPCTFEYSPACLTKHKSPSWLNCYPVEHLVF